MSNHPKAYTAQDGQIFCPECVKAWDRDDPDPPPCVTPDQVIHTTVGVNADGSMKINGVCAANLAGHMRFNALYRPGWAMFVDGECVKVGHVGGPRCLELLPEIKEIKRDKDTAPYR